MKQPPDYSTLSDRDLQFLQMGRATMIPGYQRALEHIEAELNLVKEEMYCIQNERAARAVLNGTVEAVSVRRALKQAAKDPDAGKIKSPRRAAGAKSGWSKMSPEERSVEMRRRQALSRTKKAKANHPRDKNHPDHEQWRANIAEGRRAAWHQMSPRDQKRQLKKMNAAKVAKQAAAPTATLRKTA